jgi:aldose 1-epimerase
MALREAALALAAAAALAQPQAQPGARAGRTPAATEAGGVTKQDFGKTADGQAVDLYTLKAGKLTATITTYGGAIVSLLVPDKSGQPGDIVLGFDSLDGYLMPSNPYFGALIGRYGNRIGHARFTLEGHTYTLPKNDGENTLHGGTRGFDKVVWEARPVAAPGGAAALELRHVSPDGDQGFPGTLTATVVYTLTPAGELTIDYRATTDKTTVVNLTNHAYFNLKGAGNGDILDHRLTIDARYYTPVDQGLIPTGKQARVDGTPFDFRTSEPIGSRIGADDEQLRFGRGYDHNFVLVGSMGTPHLAARVVSPESGRTLEVITTEPGLQFYTGNFLDGTIKGKGGKVYGHRSAFCLETQHFPDSPNQPSFPSVVLRPGTEYHTTTTYRFGVAQ